MFASAFLVTKGAFASAFWLLKSIDQGPFELGTTRDTLGTTPEGGVLLGPERPRTYEDLSDTEKKRYDADVRATNIVLQGLPKDIYKLINHNIDKSENINDTMFRLFHKLVNDMRNIIMTMPNIQLNSKFVNNMSPEWDRFVTAVKLNKGLKETNHEQLYAYLKQHEKHVAQDRLIIERITPATNDQLAFVSTVQPHAQSSHVPSHQYLQLHFLNEQITFERPSNTRNQATIQDGRVVIQNVQGRQNQNQRYAARGNGVAGNGGHRIELGMPMKVKENCQFYNIMGRHIAEELVLLPKRPQKSIFKTKCSDASPKRRCSFGMKRNYSSGGHRTVTLLIQIVADEPTAETYIHG
ncbi:hypothetical protein Tco_1386983 [Tanacetum coccineum]